MIIKTDKEELCVVGNVKAIEEKEFVVEPSLWNTKKNRRLQSSINYSFDRNGNVIELETKTFHEGSIISSVQQFEFNEKDQKLKTKSKGTMDSSNYIETLLYDELGNKTESLKVFALSKEKSQYKYSILGYLMEKMVFDNFDMLTYRFTYKYNEKGCLIELIRFNQKGLCVGSRKYRYNNKKCVTEIDYVRPNGKFSTEFFDYTYDSNTNWVNKLCYKKSLIKKKLISLTERNIVYFD